MDYSTDLETFNERIATANTSTPVQISCPSTLHKALIEYATVSCRLLFIQDVSAWQDFHFSPTSAAYRNVTTDTLCATFLHEILPKVNSYHLSKVVKYRLTLLNHHPGFRSTQQGYQYLPTVEQKLAPLIRLRPQVDFTLLEHVPTSIPRLSYYIDKPFQFDAPTDMSHTILVDRNSGFPKTRFGYNFQFKNAHAALLSGILSTNLELSGTELLNPEEIHNRLRRAKQCFEDTGRINYRGDMKSLVNYLETFAKLKKSITNTISNRDF